MKKIFKAYFSLGSFIRGLILGMAVIVVVLGIIVPVYVKNEVTRIGTTYYTRYPPRLSVGHVKVLRATIEGDYGYIVEAWVKNEEGSGSAEIRAILTCSEGKWVYGLMRDFLGPSEVLVKFICLEPSFWVTDVSVDVFISK